jgi:hypothetical protein
MASSDIPPALKTQILNDPQIQAEIKKQGQSALNDPQVQAQIAQLAKEKGYQAYDVASNFARDPAVQAQAKQYAAQAGQYVGQAGNMIMAQVEQGPAGIRTLSFIAGLASFGVGIYRIVIESMGLEMFTKPVSFLIAIYQVIFSLTTALFEMPPEYFTTIQEKTGIGLSDYQRLLIEKAKFISEAKGRGFFYVFQGSLWLSVASLTAIPSLVCGLSLVFVGLLNLLIGYGMLDKVMAQVPHTSDYRPVGTGP